MTIKTNYWLSWYDPPTHTLPPATLPHWLADHTPDNQPIYVAAIQATSAYTAKQEIAKLYGLSQQAIIWRFCDSKPDSWQPFNDRFPREDWMDWEHIKYG